ncbi:protein eyes shut homolog [Gigantopelta aegis]|uniref:protein eyes shut homolog n=1 Tax=Gigantopelta aegis TaxID=1735272 RepID=UPI001B88BB17|nr:protein eyes shut homolog [Gigantopelta aegis]
MRPILVLFCLVLALGLAAAGNCGKRWKYDAEAEKCICRSGYFGKTCKYRCKSNWMRDANKLMARYACPKSYVRRNCKKTCSTCSGSTCKDSNPSMCERERTKIEYIATKRLCHIAKENCPTICH